MWRLFCKILIFKLLCISLLRYLKTIIMEKALILVIVIALLLPIIIIRYASWYYKKLIARVKTVSAVHYRELVEAQRDKIIKKTRKITNYIYVLIFIGSIIAFVVIWIRGELDWDNLWLFGVIVYDIFAFNHNYRIVLSNMQGNISHLTVNDLVLMNKPFALYLRGFNDDSYDNKFKEKKFNELFFSEVVRENLRMNMYAVGMTKELDSPVGAERVYVDDECWKKEVSILMKKASRIYILVNNRESCVWEMQQVAPYIEKTVFIVNDKKHYKDVKESLFPYIVFPEMNDNKVKQFFFNSKMIAIPYSNSKWEKDYISIALNPDELAIWNERITQEEKRTTKLEDIKNTKLEKVIYYVLIIIVVLFLVFRLFG